MAVRAQVANANQEGGYLEQLQQFSKTEYLARNAQVWDRSDAQSQAKAMLGRAERKIQFKKKLK